MTISFLIEGLDTCKSNYKPDEFRGIVILCVSTSALMSLQQDCNVNSRRTSTEVRRTELSFSNVEKEFAECLKFLQTMCEQNGDPQNFKSIRYISDEK